MASTQRQQPSASNPRWIQWLRVLTLISFPGVLLAVLMWGMEPPAAIGTLAGMVGAIAALVVAVEQKKVPARVVAYQCARGGVATGAFVVAVAAIGAVSTAGGLALTAGALLSCPPVAARARRALLGMATGIASQPAAASERLLPSRFNKLFAMSVRDLTAAELCQVWRLSFVALQQAGDDAVRERIVELRQACLDEIEARDAAALRTWLAAGARAASGPDRYLAEIYHDRPDAA